MNIEITDLDMILNYLETTSLEPHDNYSSEFTYKDQKILHKYIKQLQQENERLKDELKSNPDTQITLQDDKGNKFMVIQTERIDMQVELNKTIEKLFNNWNKLKEYLRDFDIEYLNEIMEHNLANTLENILSKMQELEQGSGSDVKD